MSRWQSIWPGAAICVLGLTGGPAPAMEWADFAGPLVAVAMPGCSQEDYAAVVIELRTQAADAPLVASIEIVGAPSPPFELALSPLRRDPAHPTDPFARAWIAPPPGAPVWLSGTLQVQHLVPGKGVEGHFELRAPDGGKASGDFHAAWRAASGGCG